MDIFEFVAWRESPRIVAPVGDSNAFGKLLAGSTNLKIPLNGVFFIKL